MATGGELIIDDALFKSIERLDKALNAIKDTSDEAGKGVVKFLTDLQGADITSFTKQLETMAQKYDFLNKTLKGKGEGFDKVAENASVAAVEVKALLEILKATDEYKRESAANKAMSDSKEASEAIQRYKELSREIKNLQEIKKDASEFKGSSDAEIAKDAKKAYTEANKQLKSLLAEQKNIEKKHADEVEQYKRDANMREFREKAKLAREAANAVEKEIERELAAREQALIKQINFEQKYSVRMDKMRELATSFEERVNKSVSDEERRENEAYLKELNRRIAEEQKYVERMRHLKEMAAKVDADALKQYEEDLKKTQEAHERTIAENAKFLQEYEVRMEKLEKLRLRTADISDDALGYYKNLKSGNEVRSIQNMETALSKLREAQKRLDLSTESGKKRFKELGDAAEQVEEDINELTGSVEKFREGNSKLMDGIKDIGRSIVLLFSVDAIKGYVDKLVSVRKELELQHRSLAVLIQDRQEADTLWNQTMELAVKSPFRIKELVTYTKQLAAYRIETGKLHDTTKMLADVSAGLGVDMNRLILAYGQVRAAEYLRGTELRQFTEAGIPMLELLAEQMEKVKGKSVSTAEVFEMISKRMISFKQVDEVFKSITSSGGMFYQMQEKQSQTLSGMISILHDSIDLMLNDIGKANDGILKTSISAAKTVVDNWEKIAEITKGLAVAFALYRYQLLLTNKALLRYAISNEIVGKGTTVLKSTKLLQIGYAKLSTSIKSATQSMLGFAKSHPIILGITAIAAAVYEISRVAIEHKKRIDEIEKKYKELGDTVNNITFDFNSARQEGNIEKQKSKLEDLIELANKKYKMEIEVDIKSLSQDEINKKYLEIEQGIIEAQAFAKNFELAFAKQQEWTFLDDILESMTELSRTTSDYESKLKTSSKNISIALRRALQQGEELSESQRKALEIFEAPMNEEELKDTSKYVERLASAYSLLSKEVKSFVTYNAYGVSTTAYQYPWKNENIIKEYESATKVISIFANQTEYAQKKFDEFWNSLNLPEGLSEGEKKIYIEAALDGLKSQENITQGVLDIIREQSYKKWGIPIMLTTEKSNDPILSSWQFAYNKLIEGIPELEKITDINKTHEDVIKEVNEEYTKQVDLLARIKKGSSKAYEGLSEEGTRGLVDKLQSILDWFGVASKTTTTTTSTKDWFSPMASSISDAHKEFIKLNKTLDNTAAKELTLAKYTKVFEEAARNAGLSDISLGQFKFETEQGTVDALNYLKELLPESAKQARLSIENALANITGEMTISDKVKQDKELIDHIESMFGNYEVSLEMEKLNIPPDLAQRLFGVESIDLSSIRSKIEEEIAKIGADKGQEDLLKQLQGLLKKVDKLDDDALKERMKRYTEFLKKGQTERVKIKLDELRELSKLEEDYQNNKIGDADYELAKSGIQKEAEKKLDKAAWDSFKGSDIYVQMFEDLGVVSGKVIDDLKKRLEGMKGSLGNLEPTELKELLSRLEELRKEQLARNPFDGIVKSIKEGIPAISSLRDQQEEYNKEYKKLEDIQSLIDQTQINIAESEKKLNAHDVSEEDKFIQQESIKANKELLVTYKEQREEQENIVDTKRKDLALTWEQAKALKMQTQFIGKIGSEAIQSISQITDMLKNWGISIPKELEGALSGLNDMFGALESMDLTRPFSIVTGFIKMFAGLGNALAGVFAGGTKDNRRERQIQRELKAVEKLQREYDKLKESLDKAYTTTDIKRSFDEANENLQKQIDSYDKIIAAEEDKKKTDNDKLEKYKQEQEELIKQQEELLQEQVESFGGNYDFRSVAREFVDAWLEAFNETGNGMKGLEENFKEMMHNIVAEQAATMGVSKIIEPVMNAINSALEGDFDIDESELSNIENKYNKAQIDMDNFLQMLYGDGGLFENFRNVVAETGELSGIQRGIESVSESTAQIIEAYLNSIRLSVADNNSILTNLANSINNGVVSNPIVAELKSILVETTSIRTLLDSIVQTGHPKTGSGIRVFID